MTFTCDTCVEYCLDGVEVLTHTMKTDHANFSTNEIKDEKISIMINDADVIWNGDEPSLKSTKSLQVNTFKEESVVSDIA